MRDGEVVFQDAPGRFMGASSHPPQMRSRLLQQLMDMGFKVRPPSCLTSSLVVIVDGFVVIYLEQMQVLSLTQVLSES